MIVIVLICCAFLAFLVYILRPARSSCTGRIPSADTDWTSRRSLVNASKEDAPATGKRYLVIGTGSVGLAIMETLVSRGEKFVKGFDILPPRRGISGTEFIKGSVTDLLAVQTACEGVDVVFATVALIRYYERLAWQYPESHAVNVMGTSNVVRACIDSGVQVLIQTSSSNVCIAKQYAGMDMDESAPLVDATTSPNHYGWTKVQAEQAIIASNGLDLPGGRGPLAASVIRPCSGIFGPNDNFMTEKPLREGEMKIFLPDSKIDYVFVENVVWGHLLLEKHMHSQAAKVGGQVFCISNEEPIVADDFFTALGHFYEKAMHRPMKRTYLPRRLMIILAYACETYQRLTRKRPKGDIALLTPAMLNIASLSYAFSSRKARNMLGYAPLYTVDEAMQKTVSDWMLTSKHS